jgi:polyhydroxybutyrate depolymerase
VSGLAREVPIDATRLYVTGHSNGSMMSYRLAAEASPHVAALAGMMTLERIASARPAPVLHIHSLDDPRALYGGGLGPPFPFTEVRVSHRPVVDGLAQWIALDHCAAEPKVVDIRRATARVGARRRRGDLAVRPAFQPP